MHNKTSLGHQVVKETFACIRMRKGIDIITQLPNYINSTFQFISPYKGILAYNIKTYKLGYIYCKVKLNILLNKNFSDLNIVIGDNRFYNKIYLMLSIGKVQAKIININNSSLIYINISLLYIFNISLINLLSYVAIMQHNYVSKIASKEAKAQRISFATKTPITQEKITKAIHYNSILTLNIAYFKALLQGISDSSLTYLQLLAYNYNFKDFILVKYKAVIKCIYI